MNEHARIPPGVDPARPAPARIYDYLLSGENNFQSDRDAAKRIMALVPEIKDCAWANRGFHQRAARWIAGRGVRQFIDIGAGLPTVGNTHDVVRSVRRDVPCRVRGQRPDGAGAVRAAAERRHGGQGDPGRPARPGATAGRPATAGADRPQPADRPADDRGHALRGRRQRPAGPDAAVPGCPGIRQLPRPVPPHQRPQAAPCGPRIPPGFRPRHRADALSLQARGRTAL